MIPHNTFAVLRFEIRRTLTVSRIAIWLMLVLFPVLIIGIMKYYEERIYQPEDPDNYIIPIDGEYEGVSYRILIDTNRRRATIRYGEGDDSLVFRDVPIPRRNTEEFFDELFDEASDPEKLKQRIADLRGEAPSPITSGPDIEQVKETVWGIAIGILVVGVITLLGLLLWATPIVQADLEGRTWIYLAVRPRGRASILLGKYLTAVIWTTLAGWTSATICVCIAQPPNGFLLWRSLLFVIVLGCMGYGALFSLIGVLIPRRAMVIAVAYTLIFEFLVSFIPAVINQFTVHYRLRNLLVQFMGWRDLLPDGTGEVLLGDQPAWMHIGILGLTVIVLLSIAMQMIQAKEYVSADEA